MQRRFQFPMAALEVFIIARSSDKMGLVLVRPCQVQQRLEYAARKIPDVYLLLPDVIHRCPNRENGTSNCTTICNKYALTLHRAPTRDTAKISVHLAGSSMIGLDTSPTSNSGLLLNIASIPREELAYSPRAEGEFSCCPREENKHRLGTSQSSGRMIFALREKRRAADLALT